MSRRILSVVLLMLVLTGCAGQPAEETAYQTQATVEAETRQTEETTPQTEQTQAEPTEPTQGFTEPAAPVLDFSDFE